MDLLAGECQSFLSALSDNIEPFTGPGEKV